MIKKILVSLDGTELDAAALDSAQVMADRAGAGLVLVGVVKASPATATGFRQATREAEAYLSHVAHGLVRVGLAVETSVDCDGRTAADWILEEAETRQADLIAMATHGRVGHDRWVHGSTTEGVVRGSTVPVMLVPRHHASLLTQRFAVPNPVLVVPLDGTPLAESALPFAQDLAETLGAQLRLIEVLECDRRLGLDDDDALSRDFRQEEELESDCAAYLEAIGNLVEGDALHVETELCFGNVAREVSAVINECAAAAVVMATHGRTGLVRSVLGSVAGGIVRHTNAPVVLVGPKALRPAARSHKPGFGPGRNQPNFL